MLGRMDMRRLAAAERNQALYGVLTLDRDFNRWGRVRLFQDLRKVRDNIADPVLQWRQRPNTRGGAIRSGGSPRSAQYCLGHGRGSAGSNGLLPGCVWSTRPSGSSIANWMVGSTWSCGGCASKPRFWE